MAAVLLQRRVVSKIWGVREASASFGTTGPNEEPVGEIWFEHPSERDLELLLKYIFTSEKLSIQVHPGGDAAWNRGLPRGKDEAWLILAAEPGASIALGPRETVTKERLRKSALDGSIEALLRWVPVKPGDVIYSPAGTVHALGGGLTLVEVQQNLDLTYRLFDYGRLRALDVEEGVEVANCEPYAPVGWSGPIAPGRDALVTGPAFVLERWTNRSAEIRAKGARPVWLMPLAGDVSADHQLLRPGEAWLIQGRTAVEVPEKAELLVVYGGSRIRKFG